MSDETRQQWRACLSLRLRNLSSADHVPFANPIQPHQEFAIPSALTFIDLHTPRSCVPPSPFPPLMEVHLMV
jgi:hypothetical protein